MIWNLNQLSSAICVCIASPLSSWIFSNFLIRHVNLKSHDMDLNFVVWEILEGKIKAFKMVTG